MLPRIAQIALLLAVLPLLAACESPQATPMEDDARATPVLSLSQPTPSPEYLTEEIPPCAPLLGTTADPCDPEAQPFELAMAQYVPYLGDEPSSVREMLDDGPPPAWVTHLVMRGTYLPGTVRCTAGDLFRPPSYLQDEFDYEVESSVR